jgi:hypothetical protein
MRNVVIAGAVVVGVAGLYFGTGCTEEELAALTPDTVSEVLSVLSVGGQGDATRDMLQTQTRDQLRDGSCCDGPALDGTGTQTRSGSDQGSGDTLRLRDGSCQTVE